MTDQNKSPPANTPAPWTTVPDAPYIYSGKNCIGRMGLYMFSGEGVPSDATDNANARLASAAPELLEALEISLGEMEAARENITPSVIIQVRRVIAKAKDSAA